MAADTSDKIWPLPQFRFTADFGSIMNVPFQQVSGLDTEAQVIDYRTVLNPAFPDRKMPGIAKYGNVTLKNGIFVADHAFWTWSNQIAMNTIARTTITIRLLDDAGKITMICTLANAWPIKIGGADMKSDGNEVAVQVIEIAHQGMTVAKQTD